MSDQHLAAVSVPATTANLGPGFDAFGAALSLRATFTAVVRTDEHRVTTTGEGAEGTAGTDGTDDTDDTASLPTGEDNLVWRALVAACDRFGWDVLHNTDHRDLAVRVDTPIPQARGLGSSSAAIVGGLALARLLAGADASVVRRDHAVGDLALTRLAAELEGHPDNVAPAVHGGLVACATTDDGELVARLAVPPATSRPLLLVPSTASLTAESRGMVPPELPVGDVVAQAARAGHVLAGLTGAWPVDPRLAGDRLHEPPRLAALGVGGRLLEQLRADGHHAWLSGAGPSLAVAVPRRDPRARAAVVEAATAAGHDVLELDWDRQGIRACVPDGCGVAGWSGGTHCTDCPLPSLR